MPLTQIRSDGPHTLLGGYMSAHFSRRLRLGPVMTAAAVFAVFVAGCSTEDKSSSSSSDSTSKAGTTSASSADTPDAASIIAESSKTTQTLQAVHLILAVNNVPNLPVEAVNADVTNQPIGAGAAEGTAKVRTQPDAPFVEAKFVVVDKTIYAQTDPTGKYTNLGPAEKIYDPGVILDKDKGLANLIGKVQNPKVEGKETVDGVATVKVTGTVDAAVVDPIVPKSGDGGGQLPITLYIADVAPPTTSGTQLPSDSASPGTGPNLVKTVIKKGDGTITISLSKWAVPVTVAKPAE